MADERDFTTLPRRALGDRRLSGMDLRVLGAISLHDGRSLTAGRGQGCWAGDRMLAKVANTDRKNVKRSTARLTECGYLHRDSDTANRRGFVVRVIPDGMAASIGGELTPYDDPVGNRFGTGSEGIGGELTPYRQGANSPPPGGELTPSIGGELTPRIEREYNQEENHIIDSAEAAHFADREMRPECVFSDNVIEFPVGKPQLEAQPEYTSPGRLAWLIDDAVTKLGSARELSRLTGIHESTISRARNRRRGVSTQTANALIDAARAMEEPAERSFFATLPERFFDLESQAQVAIIERQLKTADLSIAPAAEREQIEGLLFNIADVHWDTPTGQQAQRLYSDLADERYA